jgi:type 1 fimbria pilin
VNRTIVLLGLLVAIAAPAAALAANTIDASLIPDGTYTVKVEKVVDAKHVLVIMDNGAEATLGAGRDSIDFSKVKQSDSIKLSLIKGNVMVYADLTSH